METILVTGGAGFIGSNFVQRALEATRSDVVVLDKLTYAGSLSNLASASRNPRFSFIKADISDRKAVLEALRKSRPDHLVNFAAETHVDRSIDGPRAFIETNVVGTFELLEASRRYYSELADPDRIRFRFLQVSTDEVYGSLGPTGAFSETTAYAPNSPYAAAKAAGDHLARAYFRTYELPTIVVNASNNYGPFQFPEKLIPLTILNAAAGKPLPIYGDGTNVRDWLFVDDHCSAILLALEKGAPGEKYNVGAGNEVKNIDVVDRICDYLEKELPAAKNPALRSRSYADLKMFVKDRPGHDKRYAITSTKIRDLGWTPKVDFESGLRRTVRWYLDNSAWIEEALSRGYSGERLGLALERENR